MKNPEGIELPQPSFLTREMLAFEHGMTIGLRITTQADSAEILTIKGMTREGPFTLKHQTVGTGARITEDFKLPDIPIFVSVFDLSAFFVQGACYASLALTINEDIIHPLGSGLVYIQHPLTWPPTLSQDWRAGGGELRSISSADPAAGAELSLVVDTNFTWRVLGVSFTLVTDATGGDRFPHLIFANTAGLELHFFPNLSQDPSLTKLYTFSAIGALLSGQNNNVFIISIPQNLPLDHAFTIKTETAGFQAGDNYSKMEVWVEQFFQRQDI